MPTELSRFQILFTPKRKPTPLRRSKEEDSNPKSNGRFRSKGDTKSLESFVFFMDDNTVITSTGHYRVVFNSILAQGQQVSYP
jgi:hypothetical protein